MAAEFAFSKQQGQRLVKTQGQIGGQGFQLEDLERCEVILLDHLDSLMADDLSGCRVWVGPTRGSVFLRGCTDCAFTVAARQVRLVGLRRCTVFLLTNTTVAFEDSEDVTLCPYNGVSDQLPALMRAAGVDPVANKWREVHDFSANPSPRPAAFLTPGGPLVTEDEGVTALGREHLRAIMWRFDVDRDGCWTADEIDAFQIAQGEETFGQAGLMAFAQFGDDVVDVQGRLTFNGLCVLYSMQEEDELLKLLRKLNVDARNLPQWAPLQLLASPLPASPVAAHVADGAAFPAPDHAADGGGFPTPDHEADGGFPTPDHAADGGGFPTPDHAADGAFPTPDHAADTAAQAPKRFHTRSRPAPEKQEEEEEEAERKNNFQRAAETHHGSWTVPRDVCLLMDAARARGVDTVKWFQSGDKSRCGKLPRALFEQRLQGLALALGLQRDEAEALQVNVGSATSPETMAVLASALDEARDGQLDYRLFLRRARIPTLKTALFNKPPSPGRRRPGRGSEAATLQECRDRIRGIFRKVDRNHRLRQRLGLVDDGSGLAEGDVRVSLLIAALHEAKVQLSPHHLRVLCKELGSDGNTVSRESLRLFLLALWNSKLGHQSREARARRASSAAGAENEPPPPPTQQQQQERAGAGEEVKLQTYEDWIRVKAVEQKRRLREEQREFQQALNGEQHSLSRDQVRSLFEQFEPLPDSFVEFESRRRAHEYVKSAKGRADVKMSGGGTGAKREAFERAKRAAVSQLTRESDATVELFERYQALCRARCWDLSLGSFRDWLRHLETADRDVQAKREEFEARRLERLQREREAAAAAEAKKAQSARRVVGEEDRQKALREWQQRKRKEQRAAAAAARKAEEDERAKKAAAAKKSRVAYRKWKRAADRQQYLSARAGGKRTPRPPAARAEHEGPWVNVACPEDDLQPVE